VTAEQQAEQQAELQARIPQFDIVITTAAIPGRPAPRLVTADAVRAMRSGSVIVDLAAETGGNCELTVPGSEIVEGGVSVVGFVDVPSLMPTHASQLLSRNVAGLVGLLVRDGALVLDWDDEIVAQACVTRTESGVGSTEPPKSEGPASPAREREQT
jgi:H+-translocating NAD(P) transhydrogenase subunit alpha